MTVAAATARPLVRLLREALHRLLVLAGAIVLTVALLLVLPVFQAIGKPAEGDLIVREVATAEVPPPPPPPPEEEPQREEPEPEAPPPELSEPAEPLDLAQLEMALNAAVGSGWLTGDFAVDLDAVTATAAKRATQSDEILAEADLDQKPRVIYQPGPAMDEALRRRAPGSATVLFSVDQTGRVENAVVQSATDPAFERPALAAVRQWKFEPGKRQGQSVRFRMRVTLQFPKS